MKNIESKAACDFIAQIINKPGNIQSADIGKWKSAVNSAKNGNRASLYNLYDNVLADPILSSAVEKRLNAITGAEIMFINKEGETVPEIDTLIDTPEFEELIREIAASRAFGKSVIELGFSPDFSVFSFPRKNIAIRNLDKPRSERKRYIAAKEGAMDGYDYTQDEFIIDCGTDEDLGYIYKAAAYVLYKRDAFASNADYIEIFGLPFLIAEYNSTDPGNREEVMKALSEIGGQPHAAIPEGSKITPVSAPPGGGTAIFGDFFSRCDDYILISVLGQTMTTKNGSSLSQSRVHEDIQNDIFQSDRRYVQRILNRHLIPLLEKRGYPVKGGWFSFPDTDGDNMTMESRVRLAMDMRRDGLPVDEDYILEIAGVPRSKEDGKAEPEKETPAETKPDKLADRRGGFLNWLKNLYDGSTDFFAQAPAQTGAETEKASIDKRWKNFINKPFLWIENLADRVNLGVDIDRLFNDAVRRIYEQHGVEQAFDPSLFHISNTALQKGVDATFSEQGKQFEVDNADFVRQFKENTAVFAAFKSHRQQKEIAAMMTDEHGNLRSFHNFKKEVQKIKRDYNKNWLRAEYNAAVRAATTAADLIRYKKTAHLYPNLEYLPSSAANPRERHEHYYGTILPIDHEWWDTHLPPSEWGCECSVRNTDKQATGTPESEKPINALFSNNPLKTAQFINMDEHPYKKNTMAEEKQLVEQQANEIIKQQRREHLKGLRAWAKENLQGKTVIPVSFGRGIEITGVGVKEYLNQPHKNYFSKNELIKDIVNLLKQSKYIGVTSYKGKTSHIFEIEIAEQNSWLIANENKAGTIQFYGISDSPEILKHIKK